MAERPVAPSREELIRGWIELYLQDLHTAMPGVVEAYDPGTQRATVRPTVRHAVLQPDGSTVYEDLPPLPEVPVLFPRTAGWFLALPVNAGDTVLLVFNEAATGAWEAGDGATAHPGDLRRHHLSYPVALLGYSVRGAKLKPEHVQPASDVGIVLGADADDGPRLSIAGDGTLTVFAGGSTRLQIDPDGTVHLGAHPAAQFVALAQKVDDALAAIRSWANTHTHSGSGVVAAPVLAAAASVAATKAKAT